MIIIAASQCKVKQIREDENAVTFSLIELKGIQETNYEFKKTARLQTQQNFFLSLHSFGTQRA